MYTVKEISKLSGASVRTLHHYDAIGLLKPTEVTQAGYRLYDQAALERLRQILLFRELGFPLKEIGRILSLPEQEQRQILDDQITELRKRKTKLETQILLASETKRMGVNTLDMQNFDVQNMDDHKTQAKVLWGKTDAYREYEKKSKGRSGEQEQDLGKQLMGLFAQLGELRSTDPGSEAAQTWVCTLQTFITEHYYNCTDQILLGLGNMYAAGGSFTENIDAAGGPGTAEFAKNAIEIHCKNK